MAYNKRSVPTCAKCSTRHYNFVSCAKAAQTREAEVKVAESMPVPEWKGEGRREWAGDRLETLERSGLTLWRKRD